MFWSVRAFSVTPAAAGPDRVTWIARAPELAIREAAGAVIYLTHALRSALDRYRCAARRPPPDDIPRAC